jgi:hypothetical protein
MQGKGHIRLPIHILPQIREDRQVNIIKTINMDNHLMQEHIPAIREHPIVTPINSQGKGRDITMLIEEQASSPVSDVVTEAARLAA